MAGERGGRASERGGGGVGGGGVGGGVGRGGGGGGGGDGGVTLSVADWVGDATSASTGDSTALDLSSAALPAPDDPSSSSSPPRLWHVVFLFGMINLCSRGVLAVLEANGERLYLDTFTDKDHDNVSDAGDFFLVFGALGFLVYLAMPALKRRCAAPRLLVAGLLCTAVGCAALAAWPLRLGTGGTAFHVLLAVALTWSVGAPVTSTVTVATFSVLLGGRPQGTLMGVLGACGSVGRVLMPLVDKASVDFLHTARYAYAFLGCATAVMAGVVGWCLRGEGGRLK
jgi:hypothetical protein